MKKIVVLFLILLSSAACLHAENMAAVKLGFQTPQATETGFLIGFETGRRIDEKLDVGFSLDWFQKEFEDKDYRNDLEGSIEGLDEDVYKKASETTIYSFPIMGNVTFKFPLENKITINAHGGLGAEMLIADYNKYDEDNSEIEEETEVAFGFNWRIALGASYELGSNSDIMAELGYHSSTPSFDDEDNFTHEYDMSGIIGRVGIRFYF